MYCFVSKAGGLTAIRMEREYEEKEAEDKERDKGECQGQCKK